MIEKNSSLALFIETKFLQLNPNIFHIWKEIIQISEFKSFNLHFSLGIIQQFEKKCLSLCLCMHAWDLLLKTHHYCQEF